MPNDPEQHHLIWLLHNDIWSEDLLSSELFGFLYDNILKPRERFFVDESIRFYENGFRDKALYSEVQKTMKISKSAVSMYRRQIKQKFRNDMDIYVERQLSKFMRGRK